MRTLWPADVATHCGSNDLGGDWSDGRDSAEDVKHPGSGEKSVDSTLRLMKYSSSPEPHFVKDLYQLQSRRYH